MLQKTVDLRVRYTTGKKKLSFHQPTVHCGQCEKKVNNVGGLLPRQWTSSYNLSITFVQSTQKKNQFDERMHTHSDSTAGSARHRVQRCKQYINTASRVRDKEGEGGGGDGVTQSTDARRKYSQLCPFPSPTVQSSRINISGKEAITLLSLPLCWEGLIVLTVHLEKERRDRLVLIIINQSYLKKFNCIS